MTPETRKAHHVVAGDVDAAVQHGLTVKAKCGLVWVPTTARAAAEIPPCPECHTPEPHRFPERPHFLYRCYDDTGRLIYAGCTVAPIQRMEQHRANSWWFGQVRRIRYTIFPNKEYALYIELRAIQQEHPRWNIRGRDRSLWGAEDYRDLHHTLTKNGATEERLARVRTEASRRFGIDLSAERLADTG